MWRVPQPNVERRRSFNIDQNGEEKLWGKIQGVIWEKNIARIGKRCPSKFSSVVNIFKLFLLKNFTITTVTITTVTITTVTITTVTITTVTDITITNTKS